MDYRKLANNLLNRKNSASMYVSQSDILAKDGHDGLTEAIRMSWVQPTFDGFLTISNAASTLSEMRSLASMYVEGVKVGDKIQSFKDDDGVVSPAEVTGVDTTPDGAVKSVKLKRTGKPGEVAVTPRRLPTSATQGQKIAPSPV